MKNLLLSLLFVCYSFSQSNVLLLSTTSSGSLSITDLHTIEVLFVDGLKQNGIHAITKSEVSCSENECAKNELAKTDKSDVIYMNVQTLGSKIIVKASIINNSSSFSERVTVKNIEDMEKASIRLAKAIALRETIDVVAELDNIMSIETEAADRRESVGRIGFSLGYLYPSNKSFVYSNDKYSQIIKLGSSYYDEFNNNTALLAEATYYMPNSLGIDANLLKFINKNNISPFIGGGIGMHWVSRGDDLENSYGDDTEDADYRRSGVTVNCQTGAVFFRTYNVNLIARLQYIYIFNSNNDNGIVLDFTLVRKPRPMNNRNNSGFGLF